MPAAQWIRRLAAAGATGLLLGVFPLAAVAADKLDGWWLSDGYGLALKIEGDQANVSEITSISCLPAFTATRQATTADGTEATFSIAPELVFEVRPGKSADDKFFGGKGAASSIGFHRVAGPPEVCDRAVNDSPLGNFDVFWTTFDEHYPFFQMRHVNWRDVRDTCRPQITSETTADELFGVLKAMIEPLHDAHTYIIGTSDTQRFHGRRAGTERVDDITQRRIVEIIETDYLHGKLQPLCNGQLGYGVLPGRIGYLRITAFGGYATSDAFVDQLAALEAALDQIFAGGDSLQGLVIDVRLNPGGSDVLGVAIASRLATEDYLAFSKVARNDPADASRFTAPQDTLVRVSTRPHFHGKVVLLTGSNTVSAAETFTMALMGRTPAVTRVGESTQGVFSDQLVRRLPNGFRFALPNEIFLTADGKSFDGPGIPPHVKVPVFSTSDLENGRDTALEEAIAILKRQ